MPEDTTLGAENVTPANGRLPEVVRALRSVGIDNPAVFLHPVYTPCKECGGWDERLVPVTGGSGRPGRSNHSRACSFRPADQNGDDHA